MGYRRGFKTEANWYAREMRKELGVLPHDPLCPWMLASHLDYKVIELSRFAEFEEEAVSYLQSSSGQKEFSAITLCGGEVPLIIHNDSHHVHRQAANISHELAHALLMHVPVPLTDANGARIFNRGQEDEAHWLGAALLVSEEAALSIVARRQTYAATCKVYGVSEDLLRMRLGVTGALIRAKRRAA